MDTYKDFFECMWLHQLFPFWGPPTKNMTFPTRKQTATIDPTQPKKILYVTSKTALNTKKRHIRWAFFGISWWCRGYDCGGKKSDLQFTSWEEITDRWLWNKNEHLHKHDLYKEFISNLEHFRRLCDAQKSVALACFCYAPYHIAIL